MSVVATIDAAKADHGDVAGVTTFLGYLRPMYLSRSEVFDRAERVLRSERAATQKDLRALTDRAKNIINSFEAPDPSELLGKTADHDAAEVGIAFEHSSECSGIF